LEKLTGWGTIVIASTATEQYQEDDDYNKTAATKAITAPSKTSEAHKNSSFLSRLI